MTHGSINAFPKINLLHHVCCALDVEMHFAVSCCIAGLGAIIGAIIGIVNHHISQRQQDLSSQEAAYENM
jgi:hypothetical protein